MTDYDIVIVTLFLIVASVVVGIVLGSWLAYIF